MQNEFLEKLDSQVVTNFNIQINFYTVHTTNGFDNFFHDKKQAETMSWCIYKDKRNTFFYADLAL